MEYNEDKDITPFVSQRDCEQLKNPGHIKDILRCVTIYVLKYGDIIC